MIFENEVTAETLFDSTLLLPSISIANIPQLASDLLLHNLEFEKVATLSDNYLYPFVSPVDYVASAEAPEGISMALELFYSSKHNVTLVQQRAPLMPGFAGKHVDDVIVPLIEKCKFKNIVLLHSSDAGLAKAFPGDVRVYSSDDVLSESIGSLKITPSSESPSSILPDVSPYAQALVQRISKLSKFEVVVIFAYEGDNLYDAQVLGRRTADILSLIVAVWQTPVSWLGVYGDKPVPSAMEEGIYG